MQRNMIFKLATIVLLSTFILQDSVQATTEIFQEPKSFDSLQVQSEFRPIVDSSHPAEFQLKAYLTCLIKNFGGIEKIDKALYPVVNDVHYAFRFDQRVKDGDENSVIPCFVLSGKGLLEFNIKIDAEGVISLSNIQGHKDIRSIGVSKKKVKLENISD